MQNILVHTAKKQDAKFVMELLRKLGYDAEILTDDNSRKKARRELVRISDSVGANTVSEEEIRYEIKRSRSKKNARGKKTGN